jgi:SAM-dependent methyltransferase
MNGWFFSHPSTRGLDVDDPRLTVIRHHLLKQKKYLNRIYQDWYILIKENIGNPNSAVVELGSGAGFFEEFIPQVVKTDLFLHPFINLAVDGMQLPFPNAHLDALVLLDVFHHLQNVNEFLGEADRTLKTGGRIVMIEPWVSKWSKIAFSMVNHELMDADTKSWRFISTGPLSGSNQALPWIVFNRDREKFCADYPHFNIIKIQPMMPFRYILSGGLSNWISLPEFFYPLIKKIETLFSKHMDNWGMFALIVIEKVK